jgi:hypothetical protein
MSLDSGSLPGKTGTEQLGGGLNCRFCRCWWIRSPFWAGDRSLCFSASHRHEGAKPRRKRGLSLSHHGIRFWNMLPMSQHGLIHPRAVSLSLCTRLPALTYPRRHFAPSSKPSSDSSLIDLTLSAGNAIAGIFACQLSSHNSIELMNCRARLAPELRRGARRCESA